MVSPEESSSEVDAGVEDAWEEDAGAEDAWEEDAGVEDAWEEDGVVEDAWEEDAGAEAGAEEAWEEGAGAEAIAEEVAGRNSSRYRGRPFWNWTTLKRSPFSREVFSADSTSNTYSPRYLRMQIRFGCQPIFNLAPAFREEDKTAWPSNISDSFLWSILSQRQKSSQPEYPQKRARTLSVLSDTVPSLFSLVE